MEPITHTHQLTEDEIRKVEGIILHFLGSHELYGGSIMEGRIEYHYEYTGNECRTAGKLLIKVEGDFSDVVINEEDWNKPAWIQFDIFPYYSQIYYRITDDLDYGIYWECQYCYYKSFVTEILAIVQNPDEMEEDFIE